MNDSFPNVDTLMEIAKKDPDALDRIKREAVSALIESAQPGHQQRLRGLQWQVDIALKKCDSPMESCIKVSEMMHEKLWELRDLLGETQDKPESIASLHTADVLPFRS